MAIKVDRKEMVKGLEAIKAVVPKKPTKDVLSFVLLEAKGGEFTLTGTDMARRIEYRIAIDRADSGKALMPLGKLLAILKKRKDADVLFSFPDKFSAEVRFENACFKLIGMDVEEFPEAPKPIETEAVSVKTDSFLDMIRKTIFAVASEETRYALDGIFMQLNGDFKMVATDGRRLSIVKRDAKVSADNNFGQAIKMGVIVPKKTIALFKRGLKGIDTFTFKTNDKDIIFEASPMRITSRLLEGNFPDYTEVVPEKFDHEIRFIKDALMFLIEQATILGREEYGDAPRVKMSFSKDNVSLMGRVVDVGETKLDLPIDFKGEPFDIRFNSRFLLEGLKVISDDTITLRLGNEKDPVCMIEADVDYQHMIRGVSA